ncbi:MAG: hypothetical protein IT258_01105 [Saprospiraceae bacterium]|nr:hypothetical protein [Saprospiraceae bacterium]
MRDKGKSEGEAHFQIGQTSSNYLVYCTSLLLFIPFFFIALRLTAFHTVPFDDYTSFILSMDGKMPAFEFYSPQGYRWLYFAMGFVAYKVLPLIDFTNLDISSNLDELRANQALVFISFLFLHFFFFVNYLIIKNRLFKPITHAIAVGLIIWLFAFPISFYGIDPLTLSYTSLLLLCLGKPKIFVPLLICSVFVNEKIGLLFLSYFGISLLFQKKDKKLIINSLAALTTVSLYFLERAIFQFPGYENQTDVSLVFERVQLSIPFLSGMKGFYMNWLPLLLLTAISVVAWKNGIFTTENPLAGKAILCLPPLFFMLGVFACSDYGIGRASLHTIPFFTVPVSQLLEKFNLKLSENPKAIG